MVLDIENLTADDIKMPGETLKEPVIEEKKEETTEENQEKKDEPAEKKEEPVETKVEETKIEETKVEENNLLGYSQEEVQAFSSLSEETGVKVGSDEEIVNSLKELSQYRAGKIPGVSPAILKAIEVEKQGGNLTDFFRALSREPEKMGELEVLKEAFLEKSTRAKTNPSLAGKDFERDYKAKYGVFNAWQAMKDPDEKQAFYTENADDIEYQKELYANDVTESRKQFKELQDKFPVQAKAEGESQEKIDAAIKQHQADSAAAFTAFKPVEIPLDGTEKFMVGLTDKTRPVVKDWMNEPEKFLNAIGLSPNRIDYAKLQSVMALVADISLGDFGKRLQDHIVASKNVKTLESDLDKNASKIDRGTTQTGVKDTWDQIGEAAEAKRQK